MIRKVKRERYREHALKIIRLKGLDIDLTRWEAVWALIELYGHEIKRTRKEPK